MSIQSAQELKVTRGKLALLQQRHAALRIEPAPDTHVRELTLRSLKEMINQMKEEITRYESRTGASTRSS